MTLRELKAILNRVPEGSLDLPIDAGGGLGEMKAPFAFLGNDDGNEPLTLCVMGTISCGPLRLNEAPEQ